MEYLWVEFSPKVLAAARAGLPDWWKTYLQEKEREKENEQQENNEETEGKRAVKK
jgi:hypothetical protein